MKNTTTLKPMLWTSSKGATKTKIEFNSLPDLFSELYARGIIDNNYILSEFIDTDLGKNLNNTINYLNLDPVESDQKDQALDYLAQYKMDKAIEWVYDMNDYTLYCFIRDCAAGAYYQEFVYQNNDFDELEFDNNNLIAK